VDFVRHACQGGHISKDALVRLNVSVERKREELPTSTWHLVHNPAPLACAEQNQLRRIIDWEIPQQNSIHQTENRRIGTNAERKGQDRDSSKARISGQRAQPIANVHEEVFGGGPAPDCAALFFE
jgi:hypothetical protein